MNICKGLLIGLLLIVSCVAQKDFKNTCQNESMIPLLATGSINLNPVDIGSSANKDYYRDLSIANFQSIDVLGYGFALSGFQTACSQAFYTLVIDKVEFQNQNTRMRIVVDFRNPSDQSITKWTLVSFNYIVVSRNLNGNYADIWAAVAEITVPAAGVADAAIDGDGFTFDFNTGTSTICAIYQDPHVKRRNPAAAPCTSATAITDINNGGQFVIHAYIMGFRWNSARTTAQYLAAGVINGNSASTTAWTPASDEQTWDLLFAGPSGPQVRINSFTSALEYVKIAFVLSRYDKLYTGAYVPTGTTEWTGNYHVVNGYSTHLFSASYIYEKVGTFNQTVNIQQTAAATTGNHFYYKLPDARYSIFGLTSFELPTSATYGCGSSIWINATLNNINSYTVNTPNTGPLNVIVSGDIFTRNIYELCTPDDLPLSLPYNWANTFGKKSYFTVPTQSEEQYIIEAPYDAARDGAAQANIFIKDVTLIEQSVVYLNYYGKNNGNNDTILYQAEIPYTGLTAGAPTKFEFGFFDTIAPISPTAVAAARTIVGKTYNIKLQVNGFTLYQVAHTVPAAGAGAVQVSQIFKGLNINSTTATVLITVSFLRDTAADQSLFTYILVSQYLKAYNPDTGCCVTSCPASSGLDVSLVLPFCVSCNTQAGLWYNPNNGTCTCLAGYYLDPSKTFQCYPCEALYCDICQPTNPERCTTCANGATLNNVTFTCSCGDGYFINGTVCQKCPYKCQTCTAPNGACATCVDTVHRDIAQGCACISGYYDSGSTNCSACMDSCLTCKDGSSCASCDASKFRNLTGTICTCMAGYYEFYYENQTRECKKCNPECKTCSISPTACTTCDPAKNRVAGVNDYGHQTCLCMPGFYSTPDGSCIQSDCNADPFCSQCEKGLNLCVQCLASKNRVIKLPESICVCKDGYYPNANNDCVACSQGCGICTSATKCTSCVTLATPNNDGTCTCPATTYFAISTDGVRYCAACGPYCKVCVNSTTCTTCATSFTKTVDNQCVCSAKNYINTAGNCVPCASGCQTCTSSTVCTKCIEPLVLQGNVCQANCNNGFTALGAVCKGCPTGCLQCTENFICYYCADNLYMYKGVCYDVCPAGTIGDSSKPNWECVPCNSPCKTCMNHPSYCTSCEAGKGYLQTSAVMQSCVQICNDGTYANNGVCEVCDFKCATCIGSSTNCISCPDGQLLYKGGCWAACPAILLSNTGTGGASCVDECPAGFWKYSNSECAPCSPQCTTCSGGPDNCTSCLHGAVASKGTCSVNCGENEFNFHGTCVSCSESCYGCQLTPQNCLECARGYVRTGSICEKGCLSSQYYDNAQRKCLACSPNCKTCSAYDYCTTCPNEGITPRGGVCSQCPYPCATCDVTGTCSSCLSGFYYFQGSCQKSCPAGASPANGVCRCLSGIVSNGNCVSSCASGFTSINGNCQPCNSNCAECSGTINQCTKCISGFAIETSSQRCVPATQCSYG